jgi:hypothetical protein
MNDELSDLHGMLERIFGEKLLELQRQICSMKECTPAAIFKMSVADVMVKNMDTLVSRCQRLESELKRCAETMEAMKTIFWQDVRDRVLEYKDAYRLYLDSEAMEVRIFTACAHCTNPKPEED